MRLENVLKISLQNALKTSWRCLEDVLKIRRLEDVLKTILQDFLKTSWRRFYKTSWRRLGKTSWRRMSKMIILLLIKTSSEDVWVRLTYSSWSRRLEDVLKMSWRCLENLLKMYLRRMSWGNRFFLFKTSWRRLEDIFWRRMQKMSSKRLQDVFIKTNVCWVMTVIFFFFFSISISPNIKTSLPFFILDNKLLCL